MTTRATVIIPTFDHGPLIEYAISSARNQTIQDIEIFVIGDGAPPVTDQIMGRLIQEDSRIRYFPYKKDSRHGEIYRHEVITQHARGNIICYLSDDDLWLPTHLEVMELLLEEADFANTFPALHLPDEGWSLLSVDLALFTYRDYVLNESNRVPLSNSGHTRQAYLQLPYGWRTTPTGTPTDLYMFRQFLAEPWVRAKSSFQPTVMHFPSSKRKEWTLEQRIEELKGFHAQLSDQQSISAWQGELIRYLGHVAILYEIQFGAIPQAKDLRQQVTDLENYISEIRNTLTWKLRDKLINSPYLFKPLHRLASLLFVSSRS